MVERQIEEAIIEAVQVVFEDKSETYAEFLKLLNDFRAERIGAYRAKARSNELFKGHQNLISGFNNLIDQYYESKLPLDVEQPLGHDLPELIKLVKHVFVDKRDKFEEFSQLWHDFLNRRIDKRSFTARMKEVFIGHTNLMLAFNKFLPIRSRITLRFESDYYKCGQRKKKVAVTNQLPWDVLDNISKRLDFDGLFEFSGVCKNWREFHKIYWRNFLASQEPLLVRRFLNCRKSFSFISIVDQKTYHSKGVNNLLTLGYSGSSSGYMIMTGKDNNFVLINPFTRRKKEIKTSTFKVYSFDFAYSVLLAFVKGSKEFVLVVLCRSFYSLHVYQSRNLGWTTYLTDKNPWKVVDFAVFNNTIYVLSNEVRIGILNLNSTDIQFLELKSTPHIKTFLRDRNLSLVNCDGQLSMVYVPTLNVYKIDFSTMNFVKLESLGDNAFFSSMYRSCYALSNPDKWGYESNTSHVIDNLAITCKLYRRRKNTLPKQYMYNCRSDTPDERPFWLDWYFKHLHHEIDYSLVE